MRGENQFSLKPLRKSLKVNSLLQQKMRLERGDGNSWVRTEENRDDTSEATTTPLSHYLRVSLRSDLRHFIND